MKRLNTAICMSVIMLSIGMKSATLHAYNQLTHYEVFVADEARQHSLNERDPLTWGVQVHGALHSSPCTLRTNNIELPLQLMTRGQRVLNVELTGCGYGDSLISPAMPAGRSSVINVSVDLQPGSAGNWFPQAQRLPVNQVILRGGDNRLTWYLSNKHRQQLVSVQDSGAESLSVGPLVLTMGYE
ncbi:pilus-assembly fibrillin subunit (plasmid) [Enterobacter asburiae]|uniref:pilus-assembly fibrillin subunit n=1 Tax=Enterobacter asburiae TaxID=61645 RepID=UPI002965FF41|nr:pilus-assembly fibrillin subunit [Enterobacter asburiae]MDW3568492.1 nuclease PIN [Enterobacter asburiae]